MTRMIPLSQGKFALVDDEDYEGLVRHKWSVTRGTSTFYGVRKIAGQKSLRRMQNEILHPPNGFVVDHKDGNGLNNSRLNLRMANKSQQAMNQRKQGRVTTSRFKGVSLHGRKWRAYIKIDGIFISLGSFASELEAAKAYDEAAKIAFGEFARLNSCGCKRGPIQL